MTRSGFVYGPRTWERSAQLITQALRTCQRSHQLSLESLRLREEARAIRTLGRLMPQANPLTVGLTWEILGRKGLLTRGERGLPAELEEVA